MLVGPAKPDTDQGWSLAGSAQGFPSGASSGEEADGTILSICA